MLHELKARMLLEESKRSPNQRPCQLVLPPRPSLVLHLPSSHPSERRPFSPPSAGLAWVPSASSAVFASSWFFFSISAQRSAGLSDFESLACFSCISLSHFCNSSHECVTFASFSGAI